MKKIKITAALTAVITTASAFMPQIQLLGNAAADTKLLSAGDISLDGQVNSSDIQLLQKYLLTCSSLTSEQGKNADLSGDSCVDVFDLVMLRKSLSGNSGSDNFSGLLINEVCSSAKKSVTDAAGQSPDWIEIYNASGKSLDIGGIGLSDGEKNKFKFTFPEGTIIPDDGYILIYCDDAVNTAEGEFHAPFKLSATGESVYLTHPNYGEIDCIEVPELDTDVSYGRYFNGSENFAYLSCTPGKSNNSATDLNLVEKPVFSSDGGFYDAGFTLELSDKNGNDIYYTTDGSDPRTSDTAMLFSSGINIYDNTSDANVYSAIKDITLTGYTPPKEKVDKGIVIRAVSKTADGRYSNVEHNTYFVGKTAPYYDNMKVVSMVTDSSYLFDKDTGAYMIGSDYYEWKKSPDYEEYDLADLNNPTNYNKDGRESEFPVSIQVFDDGKSVYRTDVGARISGNWTRSAPQKSFRLYARSEYGDSKMKYSFFDELIDINGNVIDEFDKVTIWNGGNDNQTLHFRDAFIQDLASDLSCDTLASEPCLLFVDGEFWGFYMIREKADGDYISSHYGIDKDDVAILKNGSLEDGIESDVDDFNNLCQWAMYADMTKEENYKKFCEAVDIQSFMDYMTVETYVNNNDWANKYLNNWQVWRSRTVYQDIPRADGKWRFILYDTDISAGLYGSEATSANYDSLNNIKTSSQSFNFPAVLRSVIKNESFRNAFYDNYIKIVDTTFDYDLVNTKLTEYVNAYGEVTKKTLSRFGMDWASYGYSNEVERLRNYFRSRPNFAKQYLEKYCDVKISDAENLLPDLYLWTYYGDADVTVDENNNIYKVMVKKACEKAWDIQSQARGIELETGKSYKLTFEASCTNDAVLSIGFTHKVDSSYPSCWSTKSDLTSGLQKYEYTFTMKSETASDWYLYLNFGTSSGNYTIKNARLTEVTET